MTTYAETYARAEAAEKSIKRSRELAAARNAFLQTGKPSMSVRSRVVLPRDDLDDKLMAAIKAYNSAAMS